MKTGCCNSNKVHYNEKNAICINPGCNNYLGFTKPEMNYRKWKNLFVTTLLAFCLLFSFDDFSMEHKGTFTASIIPVKKEIPLTLENLKKELESQDIMCQREVYAQIKIESNHLKSYLTTHTNNMLGMRYPFQRKTKASGIYIPAKDTIIYGNQKELKKYAKTSNYAVYDNWQDAIADYKLWQEHCFKVSDRYLDFLGKVYAEDTLYVNKIRKVAALADKN